MENAVLAEERSKNCSPLFSPQENTFRPVCGKIPKRLKRYPAFMVKERQTKADEKSGHHQVYRYRKRIVCPYQIQGIPESVINPAGGVPLLPRRPMNSLA